MANELVHGSVGTGMTQAEFEAVGLHVVNSQATGDLIYASSATQLSRLGIGSTSQLLQVSGGIPAWTSEIDNITLDTSVAKGTWTASGTWTIPAVTLGGTITGAAQILSNLGKTYIGDTADANMTLGLVINQAANADSILTLKATAVAHAMTSLAETDTFGRFTMAESTSGGCGLTGFKDAEGSAGFALYLAGVLGEAADTTKSTAGVGVIVLRAAVTDGGTSWAAVGADGNLVTIDNLGTTRFIFDTEGSAHADVGWVTYAEHDDMSLISDMEQELLSLENEGQTSRRKALESIGIIGKNSWHFEKGKPKAMVNMTRLSMLHHGALLQLYRKLNILEMALLER